MDKTNKLMETSRYTAIEFGRAKDNYIVILKHNREVASEESLDIFTNGVKESIQNIILDKKNILSDYHLVNFGIEGLLKNGSHFVNLWIQSYSENQEVFPEKITFLEETDFKTPSIKEVKENICAVYIFSGRYQDEYEIKLFKTIWNKSKFESDCNKFYTNTESIQNIERNDFIERISDHLRLIGYKEIEFDKLTFGCHSSDISKYWVELIGDDLFILAKNANALLQNSRFDQESSENELPF